MSADDPMPSAPGPGLADPRMTRRARSLTLRTDESTGDPASMMDAAHRSLSEAIHVVLRLVQLAMIVLAILYVLSGFQSVKEGEQGIRLVFGAPKATNLDPGFRFSFPAPIGELVKVKTGREEIALEDEFWIFLQDQKARETAVDLLPKMNHLNPERDGSVITGDGNLAHTRWRVTYQRQQPDRFARSMLQGEDEKLIRAAVQRGIVQACAEITIEDLLKQGSADGVVSQRATEAAQAMLDRIGSGVQIERLALEDKMPPLYVRDKFAGVQSAAANASKSREEARTSRDQLLQEVAGDAAPVLTAAIGRYEAALELGDATAQAAVLTSIDDILEGKAVTIGSEQIPAGIVSGAVTATLNDARQYRSEIVNERRSDLTQFNAKMEQFKSNPLVMVHREWADAFTSFYERDNVQVMLVPPGTRTLHVLLNADPDIVRELEKARKKTEAERERIAREQRQQDARFKVDKGLRVRGD